MKALVFAAGLGTRLKPYTDTRPKALVEVAGRTLLELTLDRLIAEGFDDIVVNVHHFASQIIDFLAAHPRFSNVKVSDESAALLDTGGGLRKAMPLFVRDDAPVLIHNVDILSNAPLSDFFRTNGDASAALLVSRRATTRYLLVRDGLLVGWTNTSTGEVRSPFQNLDVEHCDKLAFSGIHLFSPRLAGMMAGYPEKFPIMDFYLSACAAEEIRCVEHPNLQLVDVGKLETLAKAEEFLVKGR